MSTATVPAAGSTPTDQKAPAASSTPSTGAKPFNDQNECKFTGRVGLAPEVRMIGKSTVVNSALYVTNEYDDAKQTRIKRSARMPMVIYGEKALAFSRDSASGDRIRVSGRIQQNTWVDKKDGGNRSRLELVVFEYEVLKKKAT